MQYVVPSDTPADAAPTASFYHASSSDIIVDASPTGPPARSFTLAPPAAQQVKSGFAETTRKFSRKNSKPLVTVFSDPRQWVLALAQPTAGSEPAAAADAPAASPAAAAGAASGPSAPCPPTRSSANGGLATPTSPSLSPAPPAVPPLEERIGLHELKLIMRAFRTPHAERDVDDGSTTAADALGFIDGEAEKDDDEARPQSQAHDAAARLGALRTLSRQEFTRVVQRTVPSATPAEIHALLAKAISETQDTVSWNELATFLVTCSRQKDDLAMDDQRFVLSSPPSHLHSEEQHGASVTCVAISRQRRLIVSGSSDGSVRAWGSGTDLAYRGLLLKVDGWVVGLHWGCRDRVLYVVTMDRYVYVVEGTTYEVQRVYHGRGIQNTTESVAYATETLGTMRVGGVALPKHNPGSERGYAGARLTVGKAGHHGRRRGEESKAARMHRLLASAMQIRRGVQSHGDEDGGSGAAPSSSAATDVPAAAADGTAAAGAATLMTSYTLTTAGAADALHQDNTPLTGAGRGPYVNQLVEEGVLTALVDAVTATAFAESAFQEDVLLLGTSKGETYLFILATQAAVTQRRVLVARHIFSPLHHGRITKLSLSRPLNALLSSGEDGRVRVTSLVSGQPVRAFYAPELAEQHASVTDFAVNAELKLLLTIGPERRALVWEWNQPSPIAVLESVNRPLCACAFFQEQILTVSRDRVLHVYDCKSFRLRQELCLDSAGAVSRFDGKAGGGAAAAAAAASSMVTQLHVDAVRQRVLGFARFPFALTVKRQVSSGCPARYRGHHAPMLTTLVSRAFGQLVSVGADGVIMTWLPRTGRNEFSFLLSNFSNASASTGAPMPPATVAMDALQRRLLTGFEGGIMVAWNVLNGQVERVLTAAAPVAAPLALKARRSAGSAGMRRREAARPMAAGAAGGTPSAPAPKQAVTAVGSFLRDRALSYLFAVGRVLYVDTASTVGHSGTAAHGSSSSSGGGGAGRGAEAEAAGSAMGEYTTTLPSAWTPLEVYGELTQLLQLSTQHVGCGTTSGAVLVYNVLSDCQEGAPLWVSDAMLYPPSAATPPLGLTPANALRRRRSSTRLGGGLMSGLLDGTTRSGSSGMVVATPSLAHGEQPHAPRASPSPVLDDGASSGAAAEALSRQRGRVVSRTIRMLVLPSVHPRLLVTAQEDGTLSCWHTLRRVCLGAVNLRAAGVEEEEEAEEAEDGVGALGRSRGGPAAREDKPATSFVFDMDEDAGELLVFGDAEGNVHVCRVAWTLLTDPAEQVAAIAQLNPAVYSVTAAGSPRAASGSAATSPLSCVRGAEADTKGRDEGHDMVSCAAEWEGDAQRRPSVPGAASLSQDATEAQRAVPVLRQLERVHVFASGLSLASLRIVDAAAATALLPTACAPPPASSSSSPPASDSTNTTDGERGALGSNGTHRSLLIVCTGSDHYVRVFTPAGVSIGELGMDEWDTEDPHTFRFMGELMGVPPAPLPCSLPGDPSWQQCSREALMSSPCYFDYLAELHALHMLSGSGGRAGSEGRAHTRHYGKASLAIPLAAGRLPGSSGPDHYPHQPTLSPERLSSPAALAAELRGRTPSATPDRASVSLLHTVLMAAEAASTPQVAFTNNGVAVAADVPLAPTPISAAAAAGAAATPRSLSTRMRRSARHRVPAAAAQARHSSGGSGGVLKPEGAALLMRSQSRHAAASAPRPASATPAAAASSAAERREWSAARTRWSEASTASPRAHSGLVAHDTVAAFSVHEGEEDDAPLNGFDAAETYRPDAVAGGAALQWGGAEGLSGGQLRHRRSSTATRVPKTPDSATGREAPGWRHRPPSSERPFSAASTGLSRSDTELHAFGTTAVTSSGPHLTLATVGTATLSTPEGRHRALRSGRSPSPQQQPAAHSQRTASFSLSVARDGGRGAVSPTLLRTSSVSQPSGAEPAAHSSGGGRSADDMSVAALLLREHARLGENSRTATARDQLANLRLPVIAPPQGAPGKRAGRPPPASASSSRAVQRHVNSLLDRRRTRHVCGVASESEVHNSAEGYVAYVTSKIYVVPLQRPVSPSLAKKQRPQTS